MNIYFCLFKKFSIYLFEQLAPYVKNDHDLNYGGNITFQRNSIDGNLTFDVITGSFRIWDVLFHLLKS